MMMQIASGYTILLYEVMWQSCGLWLHLTNYYHLTTTVAHL